jgi:hypothetical protein
MHGLEAAGRPFPFYQEILIRFVEPHQLLFTYAIPIGQLALGLTFISGGFVSLASVIGAIMLVNIALATASETPLRLALYLGGAVLMLVLGRMGAGLTWGLDRWVVLRSGSPMVLLPLRYSVPQYQKTSVDAPPARRRS